MTRLWSLLLAGIVGFLLMRQVIQPVWTALSHTLEVLP